MITTMTMRDPAMNGARMAGCISRRFPGERRRAALEVTVFLLRALFPGTNSILIESTYALSAEY